jgi:ribonuclease PH
LVEKAQAHRSTLEREAAQIGLDRIQNATKGIRFGMIEGSVVALQESGSDLLEALPCSGVSIKKSAACKCRFFW